MDRAEVYRKAKDIDLSCAFGSLLEYDRIEVKLRHSFYPVDRADLEAFGDGSMDQLIHHGNGRYCLGLVRLAISPFGSGIDARRRG